jgi:hypothetical protein
MFEAMGRRSTSSRRAAGVMAALAVAGLLAGSAATARAAIDVSDIGGVTILPVNHVAPAALDWRTVGAVTGVKDQGQCDSSWAFAITGLAEGYGVVSSGPLISLSEQQLIDCDSFGTACSGGRPVGSIRLMIEQGGLQTEAGYPYTAVPGTCKFNPAGIAGTLPGAGRVPPGDELSLQAYVATHGPVLALIDASPQSFQLYRSGVYNDQACSTMSPTQAVLVVGYGSVQGIDYWIVKNSWGTGWGEQGYIRLARNSGNRCGIATYALVAADYPIRESAPPVPALGPTALGSFAVALAVAALLARRRLGAPTVRGARA